MAKCASNGDEVEEWVGGSAWEEERFVAGGSAIVIVLVRRMCGSVVGYVLGGKSHGSTHVSSSSRCFCNGGKEGSFSELIESWSL